MVEPQSSKLATRVRFPSPAPQQHRRSQAHPELAARLFLGAGEAELTDPYVAAADVVGSTTRMSQVLRLRNYPSLELTSRLYPGQTHGSALSYSLSEGLRTLYPCTTPSIDE